MAEVFASDGRPRASRHWCQACVARQVGSGLEGAPEGFGDEDGCSPDPDSGRGGQDLVKRVGFHQGLDLGDDITTLGVKSDELTRQVRRDDADGFGSCDDDVLGVKSFDDRSCPGGVSPRTRGFEFGVDSSPPGSPQCGRGRPGGDRLKDGVVLQPRPQDFL